MTYSGLVNIARGGRGGGASGTTSSSVWDGAASTSGEDAWDLSTKHTLCNLPENKNKIKVCPYIVERGSSVGRMPDSQSRELGFESPLLPFRSLGIFFHFTTPQSTQLYK